MPVIHYYAIIATIGGIIMNFKENLKYYREQAGYKQAKQFAQELGIKYTQYIAYEGKGSEPRYELLCKIAKKLNVSIDQLLGVEKDEFCEAKSFIEKNKGFKVTKLKNGNIMLEKIFNQEILDKVSANLEKMKSFLTASDIQIESNLLFANEEDFMKFIKYLIPAIENDGERMLAFNHCLEDYYACYLMKHLIKQHLGLELTYGDIKNLSDADRKKIVNYTFTPEEKEEFVSYLQQKLHNKSEYEIPQIAFSIPAKLAPTFVGIKQIYT